MMSNEDGKKQGDSAILFGQKIMPDHKVAAQWFMDLADTPDEQPHANMAAVLIEKEDEGVFVFGWRLRVFQDGKIHRSDDAKVAFQNVIPIKDTSREQVMAKVDSIMESWRSIWNCEVHKTEYGWVVSTEMFKILKENPPPYMHTTQAQADTIPEPAKKLLDDLKDRSKYRI